MNSSVYTRITENIITKEIMLIISFKGVPLHDIQYLNTYKDI